MRVLWVDQLCHSRRLDAGGLSELSGVSIDVVERIMARRWTPSYTDRLNIAAVFKRKPQDIVWGHEANAD